MNAAGEALPSRKSLDRKISGALLLSGGLLFLLLTTVAESIYPNYSVQNNAISDLAAVGTSTFIIEETAVLVLGVSWIAGAYLLYRSAARRRLLILNVLPGLGFLLAGFSPENVNVVIHSIGALLAFPFGAIAAILSYRAVWTPFRYFSVGLGTMSLLATFMIFFGYRVIGPCGTCSYNTALDRLALGLGGWEAMIIYPLLVWLIGFGSYLLNPGAAE